MNYNKLPNKYLVLFEQAKQHMVNHKKESFLSKKLQSTAKNRNRYEHIHIYSIYLKTFTLNLNLKQFTTGVLVQ